MVIICAVVFTTTLAFADGSSCKVRSRNIPLDGEVILIYENAQSSGSGQVCTSLKFVGDRGDNASTNLINVIVKCYDASTDALVGTRSIQVQMSGVSANACFDVKKNSAYYFRISDAHCG